MHSLKHRQMSTSMTSGFTMKMTEDKNTELLNMTNGGNDAK